MYTATSGDCLFPEDKWQTLEGHRLMSSKQSDRLEVTNTGFRLLPIFDRVQKDYNWRRTYHYPYRRYDLRASRIGHEFRGRRGPVLQRRAG